MILSWLQPARPSSRWVASRPDERACLVDLQRNLLDEDVRDVGGQDWFLVPGKLQYRGMERGRRFRSIPTWIGRAPSPSGAGDSGAAIPLAGCGCLDAPRSSTPRSEPGSSLPNPLQPGREI